MPVRERAICRRLRQFRLWTSFSQAEFCGLLGLNPRAYASYEYARSQLNYPAAWSILKSFHLLNAIWLAEGDGEMLEVRMFSYPTPEETGFGPRAPFSDVYHTLLRQPLLAAETAHLIEPLKRFSLFTVPPDVWGRLFGKEKFGDILSGWLATLPDAKVNDFLNDVFRRAAQVAARYPRDDDEAAIQRRLDEMYRIEEKRRFPSSPPDEQRKVLTEITPERNIAGMTEIALLLQRLKRALEGVRKGDLARSLKVPLPRVSEWLSGRVMPSGETALRLLHWVEQREREQNAPGGAINTTKGKTQVRKSGYEKQTQVRKKK